MLRPVAFLQAEVIMLRKKGNAEVQSHRHHFVPSGKTRRSDGSLP